MATDMIDLGRADPQKGSPRMLRAQTVAEMLDVPVRRVYQLCRERSIPHVRVGRSVRFNKARLEEWIAAGGTGKENESQ